MISISNDCYDTRSNIRKFLACVISLCLKASASTARMRSCDAYPEKEGWYPVALGCCPQHIPSLLHTSSASYLLLASSQRENMDMYNKILMKKRQKQKDKELKSITDERNEGWENLGD